jgi:hypothetical protein
VIVISGALLVIAVVFLGIGLYGSLGWVYASIVVSFLAFVFMLIALRQQRSAAGAEPAPPVHPLGLSRQPVATAAEPTDSDVTLVTPAPATEPAAEDDATEPPGATESPDAPDATATTPDVPLVPATRKSAAKKTAATTSAAKQTTAAKKTTPRTAAAKKTAAADAATSRSDPTAPRKTTPRKTAVKKTVVPDDSEPSTQLELADEAEPTQPSEG